MCVAGGGGGGGQGARGLRRETIHTFRVACPVWLKIAVFVIPPVTSRNVEAQAGVVALNVYLLCAVIGPSNQKFNQIHAVGIVVDEMIYPC